MCGDCWNAAMAAPTAVVAARFAWVGYKDRLPLLGGRTETATRCQAPSGGADEEPDEVLIDAGAPPP